MIVNNATYRWVPYGEEVYLIHAESSRAMGRVTKSTGLVTISITVSTFFFAISRRLISAAYSVRR
jgi:hypothetical protein